jgi:glycine/D-amino acid oxidase-like deaminating enzyme
VAHPDLLIVGGGIIGCSVAAVATERGASVLLVEATEIGAGASGRNSGAVQHPFDPVLAPLHQRTLQIYRQLSDGDAGFAFPAEPAGLLLMTDDLGAASARVAELRELEPALAPELLDEETLHQLEPMLAGGISAIHLATGYPIPPNAATQAMAARALAAGAEVRVGQAAATLTERGVVLTDGSQLAAGTVLVAAGPWSAELVDPSGTWRPIRPTYGVTVQVVLKEAPTSIVEEGAVHTVNRAVAADEIAEGLITFSMVSVAGVSTVGSTFLPVAPAPEAMAPRLLQRGAAFVPALRDAPIERSRVCARPQSIDGRPFIGPVPDRPGVFVAAGHGPWGISIGPATAELVVAAILDGAAIPQPLMAARSV